MSLRIAQWIGLIGIAATIPLVQTVAVAKSPVEIARIAKEVTVLITSQKGQGSGVILQQQGDIYTVLTAAHVVRKNVNYKITTPDDRQYEVISSSIQTSPGDIDLAVVKFKATNKYITAKLGNCNPIEGGMDIYLAGFPAPDEMITSVTFAFRKALVTANSNKTWKDGYSLMYDGNTLSGMSGGAVLNSDGELIAIHGKGNRNKDENGKNAEKNNYNAGISINRFGMVASLMGVELNGQVAAIPRSTVFNDNDYIVSGLQKYAQKDYQGILSDYNSSIQINPNNKNAYNYRAMLKKNKFRDIQGALADYNRAIKIDPNFSAAYSNRGLLKENELNDSQGALADYNLAIQINPENAPAYYNRGLLRANKFDEAQGSLSDLNRTIELDPSSGINYYQRGLLKSIYLRDYRGAISDLTRSIELEPKASVAYAERGDIKKSKLGDYRGALSDYNRAVEISPNEAGIYFRRALLKYERLKDKQGGVSDMKQAAILFQKQSDREYYQKASDLLKEWQ